MHTGPMPDSAGEFDQWRAAKRRCPKCGGAVQVRDWESLDGAYVDQQFECLESNCGHRWWVDGPDA